MITITAVIRAKAGQADTLRDALCAVADNVAKNEPGTIGFFISQDLSDPNVFTTYERFTSTAAMELHNGSPAVAIFFAQAEALIDGPVILHTCQEVSCK
ncbi:putative quinol monooxygenase [Puniceibacterium sediminis]|uniref:Quinol monooxygenase YgiN n=1 Tax=Puniceibacterium sediminis TaxID=1608407 RepID=A0A238VI86_9RHOB|nr:putative quinol monooxygenase [Puniceibacterium sediminis]SNR33209.1 Quinol monooxygenase YgiN [Puniceibacterium sediminis]